MTIRDWTRRLVIDHLMETRRCIEISRVTGLADDPELTAVMTYCRSIDYLSTPLG